MRVGPQRLRWIGVAQQGLHDPDRQAGPDQTAGVEVPKRMGRLGDAGGVRGRVPHLATEDLATQRLKVVSL